MARPTPPSLPSSIPHSLSPFLPLLPSFPSIHPSPPFPPLRSAHLTPFSRYTAAGLSLGAGGGWVGLVGLSWAGLGWVWAGMGWAAIHRFESKVECVGEAWMGQERTLMFTLIDVKRNVKVVMCGLGG